LDDQLTVHPERTPLLRQEIHPVQPRFAAYHRQHFNIGSED
jgi:hypothetical protein